MPRERPASVRVVYWDTNVFISHLKDGVDRPEHEREGIRFWATLADNGEVEVVTSTLTYAEVLGDGDLRGEELKKFEAFMNGPRIRLVSATYGVMKKAGELRTYYADEVRRINRGKSKAQKTAGGLCTPDAIHLATAIVEGCDEFHTFDARNKHRCLGLLKLPPLPAKDSRLRITKPSAPTPPVQEQDTFFDMLGIPEMRVALPPVPTPAQAEAPSLRLLPAVRAEESE